MHAAAGAADNALMCCFQADLLAWGNGSVVCAHSDRLAAYHEECDAARGAHLVRGRAVCI
eukprot:scaffold287142_cov19-Tisochrysis_lutea.AAC.2